MINITSTVRVIVADGRKALLLRNAGTAVHPVLRVEKNLEPAPNPATREHGSDAPGRTGLIDRRSAVEQTDWHERAEADFAALAAAAFGQICLSEKIKGLILVAPPKLLARFKAALPGSLQDLIILELAKDLTKLPVHEIQRHLEG